jgi:endonuclease/exonuclease/phosphatase (EEP) superfamily protein YafD
MAQLKRPAPIFKAPYASRAEKLARYRRRANTALYRVSWAYLVLLLAFWEFLRLAGDRTWYGTVVLFGPLWTAVIPAIILIPLALIFHRRAIGVLLVALVIALFPVMGLCWPWRTFLHSNTGGQHLRVLTCNVSGPALNPSAMDALVDEAQPDLILIQEWRNGNHRPHFIDPHWFVQDDGELLIGSRYPIAKAEDFADPHWSGWGGAIVRYDIAAPAGKLHIFNIHLASPHSQFRGIIEGKEVAGHLLEVHLAVRLEESQRASKLAEGFGGDAIVAGDFNSIAEGKIYRQCWKQFSDGFTVAGTGLGHTYFGEGAAVRIDHVLAGDHWRFESCRVERNVGSPHRPVIADLERVTAGK